jgi:hypothetical protein
MKYGMLKQYSIYTVECGTLYVKYSNSKMLSWNLPGGTSENHEKPQSGQPVSGPIFEPVKISVARRR